MQETFWIFLEADHKTLMWRVTFLLPKERRILISEDGETSRGIWQKGLAKFSPVYCTWFILCPTTFPHDFLLHIKPSIKMFRFDLYFILLHVVFQSSYSTYWRDSPFHIVCSWCPCQNSVDCMFGFSVWVYFWALCSVLLVYMSVFLPVLTVLI